MNEGKHGYSLEMGYADTANSKTVAQQGSVYELCEWSVNLKLAGFRFYRHFPYGRDTHV